MISFQKLKVKLIPQVNSGASLPLAEVRDPAGRKCEPEGRLARENFLGLTGCTWFCTRCVWVLGTAAYLLVPTFGSASPPSCRLCPL